MSATFALLILGAPHASQAPDSALAFAEAVRAGGDRVSMAFFLHDGVLCGNGQMDGASVAQRWAAFAACGDTELILCVTSALKRGLLDDEQAARLGHACGVARPPFQLGGLGVWIDACASADHVVSFGG